MYAGAQSLPFIQRRLSVVKGHLAHDEEAEETDKEASGLKDLPPASGDYRVLVLNSSQEMAKEITMQLNLNIPGCSITYAPSIELARWILSRRKVDLVVADSILPDGNISKLQDILRKKESPPDLVVVGITASSRQELSSFSGYKFAASRKLGESKTKINRPPTSRPDKLSTSIKSLGADLRNDLNNPLQEIVAMVFVARASGASSPNTTQALEAIDKAARNMANVVKGLEDKIRETVEG